MLQAKKYILKQILSLIMYFENEFSLTFAIASMLENLIILPNISLGCKRFCFSDNEPK